MVAERFGAREHHLKEEEEKKTISVCETGFQLFDAFLMKLILFGRLHSAHVSTAHIQT